MVSFRFPSGPRPPRPMASAAASQAASNDFTCLPWQWKTKGEPSCRSCHRRLTTSRSRPVSRQGELVPVLGAQAGHGERPAGQVPALGGRKREPAPLRREDVATPERGQQGELHRICGYLVVLLHDDHEGLRLGGIEEGLAGVLRILGLDDGQSVRGVVPVLDGDVECPPQISQLQVHGRLLRARGRLMHRCHSIR